MSCNSCSNVTLPGVAGPAGAAGAPGSDGDSVVVLKIYIRALSTPSTPSGGSYDFSTHTLTAPASWSSGVPAGSNPCYVSNGTASVNGTTGTDSSITWSSPVLAFQNGAPGANGVSLINTITAPVETTVAAVGSYENLASWSVPANTLKDTGDTLRLQLKVLPKKSDAEFASINIEVYGNVIELTSTPPNDFKWNSFFVNTLQIDMIRTSSSDLHIEASWTIDTISVDGYANNESITTTLGGLYISFHKAQQTITGLDFTNNIPVDVQLKITNSLYPVKLLMGKLYFFKKL